MLFPTPLVPATLIRRYKRFLADVAFADGEIVTAHCANPGAMLGLLTPGARVWLSESANPKRKLPWSWELVEADFGDGPQLVGVNTGHPNAIVFEAIGDGFFPEFAGYTSVRREVKYGRNSRIDILLENAGENARLPACYVEIKNVHMMRQSGLAEFPDSVTARGAKHLAELGDMVVAGHRAVMVYLVQMQAERFTLAVDVDPAYARAFVLARTRGVEALAICCTVTPQGITVERLIPVDIP